MADAPFDGDISREDYETARAILDRLPSGVYVKCHECDKWYRDKLFFTGVDGEALCAGCYSLTPEPPKVRKGGMTWGSPVRKQD